MDQDFDLRVADWLEDDPDQAPPAVLATVLAAVPSIDQRPGAPRWFERPIARSLPIAAAAILLLAAGVALYPRVEPGLLPGDRQVGAARGTIPFAPTWFRDDRVALTIRGSSLEGTSYWQAATFDRMTRDGWMQSDARTVVRPAGSGLLNGTIDDPASQAGLRTITFTAAPAAGAPTQMVSPGPPLTAGARVRLTLLGSAGFFGGMILDDPTQEGTYRVTAQVPVRGPRAGELDAAALRAAGTTYPAEVAARYLQIDSGTLGPNATVLRDRIVADAASRAPFDIAQQAETMLRSPEFRYDTDVRDVDCGTASIPECFATYRRGYCLHFATTMAAILRDLGIPARLVEGYLAGAVSGDTMTLHDTNAHAWVQVYFPGTGWVAFDPTGGPRPGQVPSLP
jgi:hypothetical protein